MGHARAPPGWSVSQIAVYDYFPYGHPFLDAANHQAGLEDTKTRKGLISSHADKGVCPTHIHFLE